MQRPHRFREAIVAAAVSGLLIMGLCNGVAIAAANWLPTFRIADIPHLPFTASSELNLLGFLLLMGAVAALFGFFSTLNKPR